MFLKLALVGFPILHYAIGQKASRGSVAKSPELINVRRVQRTTTD